MSPARCHACRKPLSLTTLAAHKGCAEARGGKKVAPATARPRGQRHEAALYAALGRHWWEAAPGGYPSEHGFVANLWIRQYPWGAYMSPPRGFSADAGFPMARVLVEVDGGAHAAGKAKQRSDTERRGLAGAAGWRVVAVTPAQVHNSEAVRLVRAAVESPHA